MNLKISSITANPSINLALDTIKLNKQALIFVNTKQSSEKLAEEISKVIKEQNSEWDKISLQALHSLQKPTKQCERLARCLKKGIAFHHSGLTNEQKEIIESSFKKGLVKIICCTPTLAMGVDLPAYRVIIRDLKRFSFRGLQWIPVLEYLQQAGRAGRPKYDKKGEAIAVASTKQEKNEIEHKYVLGAPEDIYSKLNVEPVLRTYVLSLVATRIINTEKEAMEFFGKTFWAYQFGDMEKLEYNISRMLETLSEWKFLVVEKGNLYATNIGKRVAELYIDPLTAHGFVESLGKTNAQIIPFSFLQLISSTLEIRPLLRAKNKDYELIQETLARHGDYLLQEEPSEYEEEYGDFADSIKTALFFEDWIEEKDEEFLLEKFSIRPGEIRGKLDVADWLIYSSEEFCRILQLHHMIKELAKLRLRLKYGVKGELLPLLKLKGIGRVRARKLYNNGIKDLGDVKKTDITTLIQILGDKVAADVKEQVGEKIEPVKEGKRKGQINLLDYSF